MRHPATVLQPDSCSYCPATYWATQCLSYSDVPTSAQASSTSHLYARSGNMCATASTFAQVLVSYIMQELNLLFRAKAGNANCSHQRQKMGKRMSSAGSRFDRSNYTAPVLSVNVSGHSEISSPPLRCVICSKWVLVCKCCQLDKHSSALVAICNKLSLSTQSTVQRTS